MPNSYYVYILTNEMAYCTLCATNNLTRRTRERKKKASEKASTAKYDAGLLRDSRRLSVRNKTEKTIEEVEPNLIEGHNPYWSDRYDSL